jgi:hypothetical protein
MWFVVVVLVGCMSQLIQAEERCLHILLCEDRFEVAKRAVDAIITPALKSNDNNLKITYASVCEGKPYGTPDASSGDPTKLITMKPYWGLKYLKENKNELCEEKNNYVMVLDSDMWWNANSLSKVWEVYDSERKGKDILVSSQDFCWVGRPCKREDFQIFYANPSHDLADPFSIFYNAGAYLGPFGKVAKMFEWMLANLDSYRALVPKGNPFDDQYAITAYATLVSPEDVQLDTRQALSAVPSIVSQNDNWHAYHFSRRCRDVVSCRSTRMELKNPLVQSHCVLINCPHDMIVTDEESCLITRNLTAYLDHNSVIDRLEKFPLLFHFAADTKRMGHEAFADRKACAAKKADGRDKIWNGYRFRKLRHR